MNDFIKAFKKSYVVFCICVLCVCIAGGVFGVRLYKENKAKRTALLPPPAVLTNSHTEVEQIAEDSKSEKNTTDTITPEIETENIYEAKETMGVPVKDEFKITMPVGGKLLNEFSGDTLIYSKTFNDYRVHRGIDIESGRSEAVLSVADGVIENVYTDYMEGIVIEINHNNGYKSVYKNLSTDKMVKKGEIVTKGQVISGVGETAVFEAAEPGHIHFELMKDSEYVDPTKFFE